MLLPIALVLPWVALAVFVAVGVRLPRELPPAGEASEERPLVSVVVPARNEEHNIRSVLTSLSALRYPAFEIVVVDDRSDDRTAELARSVDPGRAERLVVVDGEALPEAWLGKPWACWQGALRARGSLLLFTDADTIHAPSLLERSVAALQTGGAGAVTVVGRQLMESFWERVVQPQIFLAMTLRYPDASRPFSPSRWRSAIANGQYILVRREVYDRVGGHGRVRGEVVEDLRLAQELVRDGHRLLLRRAEDAFATRMYRSLGEVVDGWSKNLVLGGLQTLPPWLRPLTPPAMLLSGVLWWILPPAVLAAAATGSLGTPWLVWSAGVVAVSLVFWCAVTRRFGAPWYYGAAYPAGAAVSVWILLRSWLGMRRVQWKGRDYRVAGP